MDYEGIIEVLRQTPSTPRAVAAVEQLLPLLQSSMGDWLGNFNLSNGVLSILAAEVDLLELNNGIVYLQGETSSCAFVVLRGSVEVYCVTDRPVADKLKKCSNNVRDSQLFGYQSIFGQRLRTVQVRNMISCETCSPQCCILTTHPVSLDRPNIWRIFTTFKGIRSRRY